jgi:protein gp37
MKLAKSNIGYTGIGADGKPVTEYYGWNPGGFGCSANCPGCWSKEIATRFKPKCPDCAAFRVHLHPERLSAPAETKKPGVVLCNFTCDTFDPQRTNRDVLHTLCAADATKGHVYVWLTKQAERMAEILACNRQQPQLACDFWGLTIRNQAEADAKLPQFLTIKGNLWLSLEPLWGSVNLGWWWSNKSASDPVVMTCQDIKGVVVGHDNRRGAPGTDTLEHIRGVVQQCKEAGVNVFCKQLWLPTCPDCGTFGNLIATERPGDDCPGECGGKIRWKFHTNPDNFPPDLQLRTLPWSAPCPEK